MTPPEDHMQRTSVFCDESCHLPHSPEKVMLLGCIYAPVKSVPKLSAELKEIKEQHRARGELKWTRISKSRQDFFLSLVKFFFDHQDLHFRVLVVPDKSKLDHDTFNDGSHDTFYYKMYFTLLTKMLSPTEIYDIYLDIKDTRSKFKLQTLRDVLCNDKGAFNSQMIHTIQHARSHEQELMQLTDMLIGAVAYRHRGLQTNAAKVAVVNALETKLKHSLLDSTPLSDRKFNIFVWKPREKVV